MDVHDRKEYSFEIYVTCFFMFKSDSKQLAPTNRPVTLICIDLWGIDLLEDYWFGLVF